MTYGMYWTCWRCAHRQHFAGPIEPVELEHLTCARCGAHESIDPTEGAPEYEQVLAGQQQIPGIARFPDPLDPQLEIALGLAVSLGQLVERSNQSGDVETQARLQESIEWTREQLRATRQEIITAAPAPSHGAVDEEAG